MSKLYKPFIKNSLSKLGALIVLMMAGYYANAQNNVAPLATASAAPACNTGPCTTLNDLNFGTCGSQQMWITSGATNPGASVNITFTWSTMQVIKGITVHAGQSGTRFLGGGTIQVWNGSAWVNHHAFVQSNNAVCNYNVDFNSVATTQMRIVDMVVTGSQSSNVNFREIEIWQGSIAPNDIGVAAIDSPSAVCAGTYGLTALVQNYGTNQVTSCNVNWTLNGIAQPVVPFTGMLDTNGGSGSTNAQVLLSSSFTVTNTPQTVKAWTSNPNFTTDTINVNDTALSDKRAALAGNFTIGGTNPDFTTFGSAIAALKNAGLCGAVTFTVRPGTYNEQVELIGPIPGSSPANTITFDGVDANTRTVTESVSQGATFIISGVDFVTLKNLTVINSISGNGTAIAIGGAVGTNYLIDSCVALMPNVGTSTSYAIAVTGNNSGYGNSNNQLDSVTISNCVTDGAYYGLLLYGNTGGSNNNNRGHRVINNKFSAYYMGAYVYYIYNGIDFMNNTIDMSTANSGTQYGLYFYYCQSFNSAKQHVIANNTVKNSSYYGMYIYYANGTSTNPTLIYNNVIAGGFRATTNYGMYVANNSSYMSLVYHNSILVDGPNTKYGFYYTGGSTASEFKNNIFMTHGTSGTTYPAYWASNPASGNVNYNNYFNSVNATLGYRGGAFTTANYQTTTAGGDSSINAMPLWNADLRIGDGCLGKGVDLTSIVATDIDGQTRTTTPDLGADEFPPIANNIALVEIFSPQAPITTGLQDLKVIVRNVGSTSISSVNVSYKNNTGSLITQSFFGTLAPCSQDTVIFTGANQVNLGAINNLLVYTSIPNFNPDGDPTNDTIRTIMYAPLSGVYTIGASPTADFVDFANAIDVLGKAGISGPVTFNVDSGIYNEQAVLVGPVLGASATNTVTFDGIDAATRKLTASVPAGVFVVRNASYITIKNLSVENTFNASSNRAGIAFGGTVGVSNKVIKCNVDIGVNAGTSSAGYCIIFSGDLNGVGVSAMPADSSLIDSNIVNGGGYGIVHYGSSNASNNSGVVITNNVVNNCNYMGGYIDYNYNPVIVNYNEFNMLGDNYGYYGLRFYYNRSSNDSISHEIIGNKIMNFGGYGIYAYYPNNLSTTAKTKIYNNVVVGGTGSSYPGYYGIYLYQGSSVFQGEVYHNTVQMNGSGTSTTYTCFYNTGSTNTIVKNNIFSVTNGSYTPMYLATNPSGNVVNYNIYYNATNTATGNLLYRGAFRNPSNYLSTTAGGDSSMNIDPPFTSSTDFSLVNSCIRGVNLTADVPNDIVGVTRSLSPNIGAYEYPGSGLDIMPAAVLSPAFPVASGLQDVRVLVRNNGTVGVSSFNISYVLNNGTPVTTSFSGTLATCDTVSVYFTGAQQVNITGQVNNFRVYTSMPNFSVDAYPANDTLDTELNLPLNGTYTVGPNAANYPTFNAAINALNTRGVGGPVIFNVQTGNYNEELVLTNYQGTSAANTVTFKSMANNSDSVRVWMNSGASNNYVVKFDNASFLKLQGITFEELNTAYGRVVEFAGSGQFDTIVDCQLLSPIVTTTSTNNTVIYAMSYGGNNIVIKNNKIVGGGYAAYVRGVSTVALAESFVFDDNDISDYYYMGLYFYYNNNLKVRNNSIMTGTTYSTIYNIYNYYSDAGLEITGNKIYSENGSTVYGIRNNYCDAVGADRGLVANNSISINGSGTNYGIYDQYNSGMQVMYNTVNVRRGAGYAAYFYQSSSAYGNNEVYNNIFHHNGSGYAIYNYNPLYCTTDFNNLNSKGTLLAQRGTPGATYANLGLWRAALNMDMNSLSYPIEFINDTVCMPKAADSTSWAANARATFLTVVTKDINGTNRSSTRANGAPDLGAFEFTPTSVPPLCTAVPATPAAGVTQAFLMGEDTVCTILYDAFSMVPSNVDVRQYTGTTPPMIGSATHYFKFYVDAQAPAGFYNYTMNLFYKEDWRGTVTNEIDTRLAKKNANNPWTVYLFSSSTVDTTANIVSAPYLNDFSWFTGTDNTNPLPVKLTQFVGSKTNNDANLTWTTASEINSKMFVLERSLDANHFETVSQIAAAGNSEKTMNYSFIDRDIFTDKVNAVYYRLKMVDRDGSFQYSNVVVLRNVNSEILSDVNVYPNPFNNQVFVSDNNGEVNSIKVLDINGREVFNKTFNTTVGEKLVEIPSNLKSGIYFITINNVKTVKVIKN